MSRCVDCKYWSRTNLCFGKGFLDTGWCQSEKIYGFDEDSHKEMKDDEAGMLVKYWNCNFKTGKDFGCIHFMKNT